MEKLVDSFELYKLYISIKLHFSSENYDFLKYGIKKIDIKTFHKRNDKIFFDKLAKHPDPHGFLLANLSLNEKLWIRDLAYSENAESNYKNWLKHNQALTYNFKQDLVKLDSDFNKNFICENHQHPILLKKYLANEISLETLCILVDITGALKYWNKEMEFDFIYDTLKLKIKKYIPFIKYSKENFKKIALDFFR